ncbi:MAG: hypothetical protein EZS28_033552 [Streblomastix strix]|uniref:Uncharacterized protein n=1 Tax=Streblomastix strix TaxID=222440 RepID=A0A5J4ULJ6_9EUKA|nr:MAG: hypothetical protein EZS28_033552 [Streblomastix strix]
MWSNEPFFEEWRKHKKDTKDKIYSKWSGVEEDINGDKCPEFVDRYNKGYIQSANGLRITVPIKRQRVTKYFSENPTKDERQEKHYKQWKEEDKPAEERGYTVAQVYQQYIWTEPQGFNSAALFVLIISAPNDYYNQAQFINVMCK